MSVEWSTLPLLPLRCILDHLSVENAMAATATCRHWRQALLLYEGRRDTLTLKANNLEKNLFLTRVFRKYTRKLHIHINCSEDQLNKFLTFVLPQFFDTKNLQEVVFIGPLYLQHNPAVPFAKLKRVITESLVFKHSNIIEMLAFLGCEMGVVKDDKDRFVHKQVEYYSTPLSFPCVSRPADAVLSRCNVEMMQFSSLKHIIFEYELISTQTLETTPYQISLKSVLPFEREEHIIFEYELISTQTLETLSQLTNLSLITLNVVFKRQMLLTPIDWRRVNARFVKGIDVSVNIIGVPHKTFRVLMDTVFVEGMSLTSLKVMFCKTLYIPLISHVCCLYNNSLEELVWADAPYDGLESSRIIRSVPEQELLAEVYNQVNPFILLCWQCVNLRRLAIHGYWIWQYDTLGFVRLRQSLKLEISSLYAKQDRFGTRSLDAESVLRVMHYDSPPTTDSNYVKEVNNFTSYQWRPRTWRRLHPGLKNNSSTEHRADYIVKEVLKPLGVT